MFSLRLHFWVTAILTLIHVLVAWLFVINLEDYKGVIDYPQFTYLSSFVEIKEKITLNFLAYDFYRIFFLVDFIWAPFILSLLCRIVIRNDHNNFPNWTLQSWLLVIFSLGTFVFDIWENYLYLSCQSEKCAIQLRQIVIIKTAFIALVLFTFLINLYQRYVEPNWDEILKSIKATRFSLIIIFLLILLITKLDQGSTVLIHLFLSPYNCIITILLLNILAFACSHYPDYMWPDPLNNKKWILATDWFKRNTGLGFIYYSYTNLPGPVAHTLAHQNNATIQASRTSSLAPQRQSTISDEFFGHFRKAIGALFFLAWMYTLLFIIEKYAQPGFPVVPLLIGYTLLFGYLYTLCYRVKSEWNDHYTLNEASYTSAALIENQSARAEKFRELMPNKFKFFMNSTIVAFLMVILFTMITFIIGGYKDWLYTGLFVLITSVISLFFFVLFQNFRKVFTYYIPPWHFRWTGIHLLHNDLFYVITFAMAGYMCLGMMLLGLADKETNINTLNWVFIFFYLYYGLFIILLKHNVYYDYIWKNKLYIPGASRRFDLEMKFFRSYVPILPVLLIIWFVFAANTGNGLHRLRPVKETTAIDIEDYSKDLEENIKNSSGDSSIYYIATYGGGLRATAWTMLLLNTISDRDANFIKHTAAMSGVSGGFIGLAMFNAVRTEHSGQSIRNNKTDAIGRQNILSVEVANLLSTDLIREGIPYVDNIGNDRDAKSMREYADVITSDTDIDSQSFRQYWTKGYRNSVEKFSPALIGNTTGTHGRHGVAFSLKTKPLEFDTIFPGAEDILSLPDQTTSVRYLDASSTTERFPIFSPAAEIEGKGHYLDGGYFENSGLMSLINFKEYLENRNPEIRNLGPATIVLIINDKGAYVRKVLHSIWQTNERSAIGETKAILETVANIDILPFALERKCELNFKEKFCKIYLPYRFTMKEAIDIMGGIPINPIQVQDVINASNKKIEATWAAHKGESKSCLVEPALARVLSDPAYDYMKSMLNHPEVDTALTKLR